VNEPHMVVTKIIERFPNTFAANQENSADVILKNVVESIREKSENKGINHLRIGIPNQARESALKLAKAEFKKDEMRSVLHDLNKLYDQITSGINKK
jgi:hypothetical protein